MEDVKLPTTVEEFQRARREAFRAGIDYADSWASDKGEDDKAEERRRYPIRRRKPRYWSAGPTDPFWFVSKGGDRIVYTTHRGGEPIEPGVTLTAERIRAWADLLARPYDLVED